MADLSAYEQLLLELVNRARLDPLAEAARLGIDLNQGLAAGTLNGTAKQVLAGNSLLNDSATGHSDWMLATDTFSHTGAGGSSPGDRMAAAGYSFTGSWTWGENIAWVGTTGTVNQLTSTIDINDNLFLSPGHRENMLGANFREMGAGISTGPFTYLGTTYNSEMATENFAKTGTSLFVTGVTYNDLDHDRFYDVGEAIAGRTVTVKSGSTVIGTDVSEPAGGYGVAVDAGALRVHFSGGGLTGVVTAVVTVGTENAKVDLVGTDSILASATTTLGGNAKELHLLGVAAINGAGNNLDNIIEGNSGANRLVGFDGNDTLTGGGGRDFLTGGIGADTFDFNVAAHSFGASRDRILDFNGADDTIDLSGVDANTLVANDQVFDWRGTAAFTGVAGQVRYVIQDNVNPALDFTFVYADSNGDRVADFNLEIAGLHTLAQDDFLL